MFSDITNHWSEPYVAWATGEINLIKGYEDGTFKPEGLMTREDYIIALNQLLHSSNVYNSVDFIRYTDSISYIDIKPETELYFSLYELNVYLEYYGNTTLRLQDIFPGNNLQPNRMINRYEAALLARSVTTPPVSLIHYPFKDLSRDLPYYQEIMELVNNGIIKGSGDQTLRLSQPVSRAEGAVILNRVHNDLKYTDPTPLTFKAISISQLNENLPVFSLKSGNREIEYQNQRFIKAISSLEYLAFVGYIPYNERHLYDGSPIETLWQLKNEDYPNLVGNNYYLIVYDKETGAIRKKELIEEAILHIKSSPNDSLDGLYQFLREGKKYVNINVLIDFAQGLYLNSKSLDNRLSTGLFLIEEYQYQKEFDRAMAIYESLLFLNLPEEITKQVLNNYIYLVNEQKGKEEAIRVVRSLNERMGSNQTLTALLKQLMMN